MVLVLAERAARDGRLPLGLRRAPTTSTCSPTPAEPFQRLHDLYVRGALRRGLTVTYADANGKVATYAVAWWKVVLPTNGDFAFAAQSRPSMTLQTCVGANDRYRLVVRLYRTH